MVDLIYLSPVAVPHFGNALSLERQLVSNQSDGIHVMLSWRAFRALTRRLVGSVEALAHVILVQ
jgi:hypothetical protein